MQTIRNTALFFASALQTGCNTAPRHWRALSRSFAWGGMYLILYHTFYQSGTGAFPMDMQALSAYIWLQQAFLALFMVWDMDNDIFELISSGNIAYELCRPCDLYSMIFFERWEAGSAGRYCAVFQSCSLRRFYPALMEYDCHPLGGRRDYSLYLFYWARLLLGPFAC